MFLRVYQHTSRPYQLALCEWWVLVKFKVHVPFVQKFNFSRISSDIPVLFLSHGFWHQTTTVNYYTCFKLISMLCASLFLLDNLTAKHSLYNSTEFLLSMSYCKPISMATGNMQEPLYVPKNNCCHYAISPPSQLHLPNFFVVMIHNAHTVTEIPIQDDLSLILLKWPTLWSS